MRAKRKPTVVKYNRLKRIKTNRYRKKYDNYKIRERVNRSAQSFLDIFYRYKDIPQEELAKEAENLLKEING